MRNLLTQSRVYIATYNATTFLESLAMDIPTIIFWRPEHWELRGTAIGPFEELSQAGIFHKSAESAADHLSDVWSDVDAWWGDRKVRSAIDNFNYQFNRQPADLVGAVANEIIELGDDSDGQ
jgi:putative transferase (TIGR04331 family)